MKATIIDNKVMIAVLMGIVGVGALAPTVVSAGVEMEFLACRPTADISNPGFPNCDLQTGVALNDLISTPPTGTLAVLEPDTVEHTATWESAPSAAPVTLLPGQVTLDLVMMNHAENEPGSNDICWSKHIILPDGSEVVVVQAHCFENPLPATPGVCSFGAQPPSPACIALAQLVSETVPSEILPPGTLIPAGSVTEVSIFCPGSSFLGIFFNDGVDVDGDGVLEFSKLSEPVANVFLSIDEESIDNGTDSIEAFAEASNNDPAVLTNDDNPKIPKDQGNCPTILGINAIAGLPGMPSLALPTGQVGDEGLFSPAPGAFVGLPNHPLGIDDYIFCPAGADEHDLDGLAAAPLGAAQIFALEGRTVCAVVHDSDISDLGSNAVNAMGARKGRTAFVVTGVAPHPDGPDRLPIMTVDFLDATDVDAACECENLETIEGEPYECPEPPPQPPDPGPEPIII